MILSMHSSLCTLQPKSSQPPLVLRTSRTGPRERARYGLRSVLLGEASHPGPTLVPPPSEAYLRSLHNDRRARHRHVIWRAQEQGVEAPPATGASDRQRARVVQPHQSARAAADSVSTLAKGCRDIPNGVIPRDVHEQRWSALNVPLIWAAAGSNDVCPIVDWLAAAADGAPLVDIGARSPLEPFLAVWEGWRALRSCLRSWGITCKEDLGPRLREHGFQVPQRLTIGQYLSQSLQEAILNRAIAENINAALLEASFVVVTLRLAQQP